MLNQKVRHMLHLNGLAGSHSNCAKKSAPMWPRQAAPKMLINII